MNFIYWLQQMRTPLGEAVFSVITHFGSDIMMIMALCAFLWIFGRRAALRLAISYAGTGLVNQLLKIIFAVPRPWVLDDRIVPAQSAVKGAHGYSFPSGHSQTAACIFTTIAMYFRRKWLTITCAVLVAAVMLSRMYLGVHTPWDVLTGCIVSLILTIIINRLLDRAEHSVNYIRYTFIVGVAASVVMVGITIAKALGGAASAESTKSLCEVAGMTLGFVSGLYIDARTPETRLPYRVSIPMFILGIGVVIALRALLSAILGKLPGALWQDFVRYALVTAYITGVHPAIMRGVAQHVHDSKRA